MPWGSAIQEMLGRCAQPLNEPIGVDPPAASGMTVFEIQQARLKWQAQQRLLLQQLEQEDDSAFGGTYVQNDCGLPLAACDPPLPGTGDDVDRAWLDLVQYMLPVAPEPPLGLGRSFAVGGDTGNRMMQPADLGCAGGASACSSHSHSQPGTEEPSGARGEASITGHGGSKKRRADNGTNKTLAVTRSVDRPAADAAPATATGAPKRIKSEGLAKPKQESHPQPTSSTDSGNEECPAGSTRQASSKASEKTDYIHVRARRGQATDSHSLAERVRREKISERMKYLQELVPGCNKITGKAGMLDEIINYVQSLQKQVEFLSMKLAAVNPLFDTSPDCFPMAKEKVCNSGMPLGMSAVAPQPLADSPYFPANPLLHMATCGLDTALTLQEAAAAAAVLSGAAAVPHPLPSVFASTAFHVSSVPYSSHFDSIPHANPVFHLSHTTTGTLQQLPAVSPGWNADLQCLLNDEFRQQAKASLCTPLSGVGVNNLQMQM